MSRRKTQEEFVKEVNEKFPNQYEVIGTYVNAKEKIKIKHITCGNVWSVTPSNLLHGYSCPICNGGSLRTKESFEKVIEKLYPNKYKILGEYIDARTKILVEHVDCGYKWEITPDNLKRGKGCPHCNVYKSRAIYEIEEWLIGMRIPFCIDRAFEDLYGDYRRLKFDICVYSSDLNEFLLIEYNGRQHYDEDNTFYNENLIRYENLKINYCKDNNYNLAIYSGRDDTSKIKDDIFQWYKIRYSPNIQ